MPNEIVIAAGHVNPDDVFDIKIADFIAEFIYVEEKRYEVKMILVEYEHF